MMKKFHGLFGQNLVKYLEYLNEKTQNLIMSG